MDAAPTATLGGVPPDPLIGENFSFSVTFDNASPTDVGYGPYVNLFLPATGVDGAGSATDDGVTFVSATYLGASVPATVITLTDVGVEHPFAKDANGNPMIIVPPPGFQAGDQLVVLTLPFGSFSPDQPAATVQITAALSELADVDAPLTIAAQGGFQFGDDPLDNPSDDPVIVSPLATTNVTPELFRVTKTYLGPEDETTTGPNFPRQYRISIDVADGQTLTDLEISDLLPDGMQFVQVDSVTGNGTGGVTNVATPSTTTPGGTLTRQLDSVTGTAGTNDAVLLFTFYVAEFDSLGDPVIDPTTGDDATLENNASATAQWTPIDTRDPPNQTVTVDDPGPEHVLTVKSIAVQKTSTVVVDVGGAGVTPGDTLEYTLTFQVSDYFAFDDVVATDVLGDGLEFAAGFTPTMFVNGHGYTSSGAMHSANVSATGGVNTTIDFDVSGELISRGENGKLVGGLVNPITGAILAPNGDGPTTVTIVYRVTILDRHKSPPNTNVTQGDVLGNDVSVAGSVLANSFGLPPTGETEDDDSHNSVVVVTPPFDKTIYAINGNTGYSSTQVSPGDTVTYRLTYTFSTADILALKITDYLPLPIFDASELTTLDYSRSSAPPPAGTVRLLVSDTFSQQLSGIVPTFSIDGVNNALVLDYGDVDDPLNRSVTIDVVFTVTVTDTPFADDLQLTNVGFISGTTANGTPLSGGDGTQVTIREPALNITKGVIATNNGDGVFAPATPGPTGFTPPGSPGTRFSGTITSDDLAANPIDSNLTNVDSGDLVSFGIVVENTGGSPQGAFDVLIRDTLPVGMTMPMFGPQNINLRVTDGQGNALAYEIVGNGLFDPLGGIRLLDAPDGSQGAIGADADDGSNIVVVTYDLRIATATVLDVLLNTASVVNYASTEGGPDFADPDLSDDATVTIGREDLLEKHLVGTEIVDGTNANDEAVVGEYVTYQLTITVPEGRLVDTVLTDALPAQLAFVEMIDVAMSPDVTISGSFTPVVTNSGHSLRFNLGLVQNANRNNGATETIVLTYRAVVLNNASTNAGNLVHNTATLTFAGLDNPRTVSAENVLIVEPQLDIDKSVVVDGAGASGDAGDPIDYTVVLANPPQSNERTANAYDVTFSDPLPTLGGGVSAIDNPIFTVFDTAGIVTAAMFQLIGSNATGWTLQTLPGVTFDMPVDATRTITITISGTVSFDVAPGQVVTNTASTAWTSLDGDPGPRSAFNSEAVERTGTGGINDYVASDGATFNVTSISGTKTVVSTSETATSRPDYVVPGEVVRFRLQGVLPESTTASLLVHDLLPPGLRFLNDGTATIVFVSNGGDVLTSSTIPDSLPGLHAVGNETNVNGITPTAVIPLSAILGGPFGDGTDVTFDLGMFANIGTSDVDLEYVVIEFNAVVVNSAAVQAGATLINTARVEVDGVLGDGVQTQLTVAEPVIDNLTKSPDLPTATGLGLDAGDQVPYTVAFANQPGGYAAVAYDVHVVDPLVAGKQTLDPTSIRVFRNGVEIFTGFSSVSTSTLLDVTLDEVDVGDAISIRYVALLTDSVEAGETLTNSVDVSWSSIPGDHGTAGNPTGSQTPGEPGEEFGERDGQDGAGGLNDYVASADADVIVAVPELTKVVSTTNPVETQSNQLDPTLPDFAIGELVTYRVTVTLQEGTTSLVMTDHLPSGSVASEFVSARIVRVGSNVNGGVLTVGTPPARVGDDLTWDFGDVVNRGDNVLDSRDQVEFEITVRVLNDAANIEGDLFINTATLDYGRGTISDSATGEIVEPTLTVDKHVVDPGSTQVDAGDVVTYEVVVAHAPGDSTAPAYNVLISEALPPGLTLLGPPVVVHEPGYASTFYQTPVVTWTATSYSVLIDYLDQPDNPFAQGYDNTITIRYQARVDPDVASPGDVITNVADLSYDSIPLPSAGFPEYSRNYTGNDDAVVTVNASSIAGVIYTDLNDNGVYEPGAGETLITESTTITLTGKDNLGRDVSRAITTNTGTFIFDLLPPSDAIGYTITEVDQPLNYADGKDTAGMPFGGVGTLGATPRDADAISMVVIPKGSNTDGTGYVFGELPPASIGDFVWNDADGDGIQDGGEAGVDGLLVTLIGTNPDGSTFTLTRTTAGGGAYLFENLRPGDYSVTFGKPDGYVFTIRDNPGTTDALDSDASRLTGNVSIALAIGESNLTIDAGVYIGGSLSGLVYIDVNNNGAPDGGAERGIGGVRIVLTGVDPLGRPLEPRVTTTNADGTFLFDVLPQGTYTLREFQPGAFIDGVDSSGTLGGVQTLSGSVDAISMIALGVGAVGTDYDFGEIFLPPIPPTPTPPVPFQPIFFVPRATLPPPVPEEFIRPREPWLQRARGADDALSSLSGFVYNDANGDGERDDGEVGIFEVPMLLSGETQAGLPINRATFTNRRGFYLFDRLPPGLYTVREARPEGQWFHGSDSVGFIGGRPSGTSTSDDGKIDAIDLPQHSHGVDYNFGERKSLGAGVPNNEGALINDGNDNLSLRPEGEPASGGMLDDWSAFAAELVGEWAREPVADLVSNAASLSVFFHSYADEP